MSCALGATSAIYDGLVDCCVAGFTALRDSAVAMTGIENMFRIISEAYKLFSADFINGLLVDFEKTWVQNYF